MQKMDVECSKHSQNDKFKLKKQHSDSDLLSKLKNLPFEFKLNKFSVKMKKYSSKSEESEFDIIKMAVNPQDDIKEKEFQDEHALTKMDLNEIEEQSVVNNEKEQA